jgi:hypothetical protein
LITDKVSLKGFRHAFYISSSFPKLAWRDPLFRFGSRSHQLMKALLSLVQHHWGSMFDGTVESF